MTLIQPVPRHNRGCLWGCLAVLAFFLAPVLLAALYGGWFFAQGYARDPVVRGVIELVRRDGLAETVLGDNIHVTGIEGSALTYMWGGGPSGMGGGAYVLELEGSKTQGVLRVVAFSQQGHLTVRSMMLDGPQGRHYDLLHHRTLPAPTTTPI